MPRMRFGLNKHHTGQTLQRHSGHSYEISNVHCYPAYAVRRCALMWALAKECQMLDTTMNDIAKRGG